MKNVLVIDDDRTIRLLLERILGKDYKVHCLTNGHGAEEIIQKVCPIVVFLDTVMPEREGVETLMGIKSLKPSQLVVSMSSNEEYIEIATDLGAEFTLPKPLSVDAIMQIMTEVEEIHITESKNLPKVAKNT